MTPDCFLFYVADVPASAAFYTRLLGHPPVEASPGFALFVLAGGGKLGLWKRAGVAPLAEASAGAAEIGFVSADVDATCAAWQAQGITIVQPPTEMEFGRTCCGLDPDGHRLRAFNPS